MYPENPETQPIEWKNIEFIHFSHILAYTYSEITLKIIDSEYKYPHNPCILTYMCKIIELFLYFCIHMLHYVVHVLQS